MSFFFASNNKKLNRIKRGTNEVADAHGFTNQVHVLVGWFCRANLVIAM
jgi:hypothetical protein